GEHKHLLISLLNALLPLQKGQEIVGIEYLSSEQVPRTLLGKNSIVDVKCVDNRNRYFIVEMQMAWSKLFANRLVFNASKAYVQQFDKKKVEDEVAKFQEAYPVYSLAIVNSELRKLGDDAQEKWYHHYKIADIDNPERVIEGLEFVIVELPKFKPETWSQTDKRMAVLWLRFLQEIGVSEAAPDELMKTKEIEQAVSICEVGAFTKEELAYYDEYWVKAVWEASCDHLEEQVVEKDKIIAEKDQALAEKDLALAAERKALAEKNVEMAKLLERIAQLEKKQ
ncbi:MAG: Rpn family recombination-promoting nuclease/putative transposase, partial [Prevotellaceae bacterium]|nr:Rpn family recombination-promoting nuclease/putative transposase [Prevotellaceae bacterium]